MRRIFFLLTFIALFLPSCSLKKLEYPADMPLTQFMIGKWEAKDVPVTRVDEIELTDYKVEFIDESNLEFCSFSSYDNFCANLSYKQINGNIYSVENERATGGQWEINRDGENLLICIWLESNCVEFTRK